MILSRPLPGDVVQTTGTLKRKYHFHQMFISVCTENCQNDNSWYFSVSVWVSSFSLVTLYNFWYEFALGSQVAPLPRCLVACWPTHWGPVTHICVGNLTIIGSDNGLSPGWRQAITWTNVGILSIGTLGTNFSEMLIEIHTFSFKKIHLKMSSGKKWPLINESLVWNMHLLWNNSIVSEYGYLWEIASYMTDSVRLLTCRESQGPVSI